MGAQRRAAANKRNTRSHGIGARDAQAIDDSDDHFPWIVGLACLCAGLYLFLSSTVPALREQRLLRKSEQDYRQGVDRVGRQMVEQRKRLRRLPQDPEVILVEFDRRGLLPEQAVSRHLANRLPTGGSR